MESKKINQLATELAPDLSDLTIIGDPTTGISKKITLSQMASLFTGTVEEYANLAAFPLVGVADTIYIALDTNVIYRYDTSLSAYVILSPNIINSLVFSDANGFDGTITLVGSVATLSITTALTLGSVPFIGASGALTQDNSILFFDDTNNRLGIATASPTTALDVFGSGIIGRLNATSTNNAFIGFASNGTNKWSAGNVQSDHRFRIFSEANSAELITILQTGEFGIGIANPLTKLHIDGGATALIANLDANVSVAKSVSFRSDNSSRFNIEVSGTESGSDVGADFQIKRFSDAGSLIDTPLTITRSTGALTFSTITNITNATASTSTTTGALVVTGGVGIGGALFGTSASFSSTATATAFIPSGATIPTNGMYLSAANTLNFATNSTNRIKISSTGEVGIATTITDFPLVIQTNSAAQSLKILSRGSGDSKISWYSADNVLQYGSIEIGTAYFQIFASNSQSIQFYTGGANSFTLASTGAATFTTTQTTGNALTINVDASSGTPTGLRIAAGVATIGSTAKLIQVVNSAGDNLFNVLASGAATFSGKVTSSANESSFGSAAVSGTTMTIQAGSGNGAIRFKNAAGGDGTLLIQGTSTSIIYRFDTYSVGNAFAISNAGVITIGQIGSGTVTATSGVLSAVSDMNLKIEDGFIDNALEKVMNLKPRYFHWKEESGLPTDLRQLGFYAQEVNQALGEEAANTPVNENDKWGIYDRAIIAMLTKAIQELKAEIDILKIK
jgi:hypothetical protein